MDFSSIFSETTLRSDHDDLEISMLTSIPRNKKPKAIIQILHGMAEHKERYMQFMDYLSLQGYVCVINDQRGHGKSIKDKGDLGYWYSGGYEAMIDDAIRVISSIKTDYGDVKLFLLGHSMGSLVARSLIKRKDNDIDGLILSGSPSYDPALAIGQFIVKCISIMRGEHYRSNMIDGMIFGSYGRAIKDSEFEFAWLSTDEEIVKKYEEDELCGFVFTANGYENLFRLTKDAYNRKGWVVSKPVLPILFVSGSDDPCHNGRKNLLHAVESLRKVGYSNVSYKLFEGMRHEILNEKEKDIVWGDVLMWLSLHL